MEEDLFENKLGTNPKIIQWKSTTCLQLKITPYFTQIQTHRCFGFSPFADFSVPTKLKKKKTV